jgi:hypothetical protein
MINTKLDCSDDDVSILIYLAVKKIGKRKKNIGDFSFYPVKTTNRSSNQRRVTVSEKLHKKTTL